MSAPVRLSAVTALPRHEALGAASAAISAAGGWVEDVHSFAGHAATIRAVIAEEKFPALHETLAAAGLAARAEPFEPGSAERPFTLMLAFANPDDRARSDVPPIPG